MDADAISFPEPDSIAPLAMAFARMMFAHAAFEVEVRRLQSAITTDPEFGERPCNQWGARERPARVAKLIESRLGDIEEAQPIADILTKAIKPTDDRNLLAHGHWWRFQRDTLTVRRGTIRKGESMHVEWTVVDINRVAEMFADLEIELFKIRREIERNWVEAEWPAGPE